MEIIIVKAEWDPEASVWVATSSDVPGLVTEAETVEKLRTKILPMIEELIELNNLSFSARNIPVHIVSHSTDKVGNPLAA